MNKKGRLFVLSGSSGGGKTTIIRQILARRKDFTFSISSTTRPARDPEKDGIDYDFISEKDFQSKIENNEFVEWAEVHGQLYGTTHESIRSILNNNQNVILDVDVKGGREIKKKFPESILVYIHVPSIAELKKRLITRGTNTPEQIKERLTRFEFEHEMSKEYQYRVENDDLDTTVNSVLEIIEKEI